MKLQPFQTLKHYNKKNLPKDILAGIIIMASFVPLSIPSPTMADPTSAAGAASTPKINFGDVENNPNRMIGELFELAEHIAETLKTINLSSL